MLKNTRAVLRIILGGIVLIFGLNKFLHFIPLEIPSGPAQALWSAFDQSAYFFPMLGSLEILLGLVLISGFWTKLALVILLPISINALLFHLFLFPEKVGAAAAVFTLNVYFIILNFREYKQLINK